MAKWNKIGKCIKIYGDIAYEQLPKDEWDRGEWLKIKDLFLFARAIYFTLKGCEKLGEEKYEEIIKCLQNYYKKVKQSEYNIIDYIPGIEIDFSCEKFFLRLCLIVFTAEQESMGLIKKFMEAYYFLDIPNELMEGKREEVAKLTKLLETGWEDTLIEIYERHCRQPREKHTLESCCQSIRLFIKNIESVQKPDTFHVMA